MEALKHSNQHELGYEFLSKAQGWAECGLPDSLIQAAIPEVSHALRSNENPALTIGRVYETRLSRESRRSKGSFYTPKDHVDYVVQKTLGKGLNKGRILDPSAGGGAFLVGALDYLASSERFGHRPSLRRGLVEDRLAAVDIDPIAVSVCKVALAMAVGGPVDLSWIKHGDALDAKHDFSMVSAIVGNPPWGQKGFCIDADQRTAYRERFLTAKGHLDPYGLFIEQIHTWLETGGRWGMILPEVFLLKGSKTLRGFVLERSRLLEVLDVGDVFPGVNLGALIVVGEIGSRSSIEKNKTQVGFSICKDSKRRSVAQSLWQTMPDKRINLHISRAEWTFWNRLSRYPTLGDLFEIHEGVHSGNMRQKLFVTGPANKDKEKLFVGGKEMSRFQLNWAGQYLDVSAKKEKGEYASLGQSSWRERKKILVRRTGDRVMAALDIEGLAASNNFFLLLARSDVNDEWLDAVVALLNSELYTWWYRALNPRKGRLFAEIKIKHLKDMPIPRENNWEGNVKELASFASMARLDSNASLEHRINPLVERAFEVSLKEHELIKMRQ